MRDVVVPGRDESPRLTRVDDSRPRWSTDRAIAVDVQGVPDVGKHHQDGAVTRRAPDAPKVGRTKVRGQWESLTVFRSESSDHYAVVSPEVLREMQQGRQSRRGFNGNRRSDQFRAARLVVLAAAAERKLSTQETAAKMTAGTAAYQGTADE